MTPPAAFHRTPLTRMAPILMVISAGLCAAAWYTIAAGTTRAWTPTILRFAAPSADPIAALAIAFGITLAYLAANHEEMPRPRRVGLAGAAGLVLMAAFAAQRATRALDAQDLLRSADVTVTTARNMTGGLFVQIVGTRTVHLAQYTARGADTVRLTLRDATTLSRALTRADPEAGAARLTTLVATTHFTP